MNPAELAALAERPWAHDFFQTLRRIEAQHPELPRLGSALRPRAEPLRLGQDVELDMAPAALSSFAARQGPPRLGVRFFGLFGPNGPLPLHLTEYVRERARHHGDAAPARFADIFHHRALLLYYRAWAQAQPAAQLDRADDDAFARWLGSLAGQGGAAFAAHDGVPDAARRFHVGTLARGPRNAEGLEKILRAHFGVPAHVQPHLAHWLPLPAQDCTRLLNAGAAVRLNALGVAALAGRRVRDRQSRFGLRLGPLGWADYERFLPGQPAQQALRDWVGDYVGAALSWELRLCLRGAQVPPLQLLPRAGRRGGQPWARSLARLGWTCWLGTGGAPADRADLRLRSRRPDDDFGRWAAGPALAKVVQPAREPRPCPPRSL